MGTTKKNPGTVPGKKPTVNAKTTMKTTTAKGAATKTAGEKKPAGRLLRKEPLDVPRRPEHHYGRIVVATSVEIGDVIYTGTQRNLSTVEVLDVRAEKANPDTHVLIETAAISLLLDGKEYTAGERVYLRSTRDASIALRSGPSH
jgi:hypothetical protein